MMAVSYIMDGKTQTETVRRDMTLGEVVKKHPESVNVMLSYGLHCIGCHVSYEETIEQGAKAHGMSEEQIKEMVEKINSAVKEGKSEKVNTVSISESAAKKLKELRDKENKQSFGLRVGFVSGGCSGYTYIMDFQENKAENDEEFEEKGLKIFVDKNQKQMIEGLKIDYTESLQGSGFRIVNPNAQSTCGCGSSFS